MANQEHLDILKQGENVLNQWRQKHADVKLDLADADLAFLSIYGAWLHGANLDGADLSYAILSHANLSLANLNGANLRGIILSDADLSHAILSHANLSGANLYQANLSDADLSHAILNGTGLASTNLNRANLRGADLHYAKPSSTIFGNVDLSTVKGLEMVEHGGPSTIGIDTIIASHGKIPESFLREAGVPSSIIEQIPSLIGSLEPIQYYTCFISYSSKDQNFAERLYADLQREKVRCWFAPEDMKIGDRIRDRIDQSIRLYDKLLLILSEQSVMSEWVEDEVEAAMEKERLAREQGEERTVLFPVRLDEAVKMTTKAWAAKLRRQRHLGDFSSWKNHDDYDKAFTRLLRDLKAEAQKTEEL